MHYRFPLKDVTISTINSSSSVDNPKYQTSSVALNQTEFWMSVQEVGEFYATQGKLIEVIPDENVSKNVIELYLNGSVYGAILHQRQILPLHGSSFCMNGLNVLLCGASGVGKSSLTTAFCLDGATFLTDDVTPILFEDNQPLIVANSDCVKLWEDSILQLGYDLEPEHQIFSKMGKYYFPMPSSDTQTYPLERIIILAVHEAADIKVEVLKGLTKIKELSSEIYRPEYLEGMPQTRHSCLKKVMVLCQHTEVVKITRPVNIEIKEFKRALKNYILASN